MTPTHTRPVTTSYNVSNGLCTPLTCFGLLQTDYGDNLPARLHNLSLRLGSAEPHLDVGIDYYCNNLNNPHSLRSGSIWDQMVWKMCKIPNLKTSVGIWAYVSGKKRTRPNNKMKAKQQQPIRYTTFFGITFKLNLQSTAILWWILIYFLPGGRWVLSTNN